MKQLLSLIISTIVFLSCKTSNDKISKKENFQIVIADTTNNNRAKWDWDDLNYHSRLENQLGLSDLKNGADSLEIRLWYDFSFSELQNLYILKFIDTSCIVSFFRVYQKKINYENENRDRNWNPFKDPKIDSSFSKTVTLSKDVCQYQNLDSIWFLKSQSDLQIPDSIDFTDCDSYTIEIADKKHLKYLRHHCSYGYYNKTKLKAILDFEIFCMRIISIAVENKVVIDK